MYGSDQPGKVAEPCGGQLNWENVCCFPCPHLRLRICSGGTGSAVHSRVSLLILHTQAEADAYLRDSSRFQRRRPPCVRAKPGRGAHRNSCQRLSRGKCGRNPTEVWQKSDRNEPPQGSYFLLDLYVVTVNILRRLLGESMLRHTSIEGTLLQRVRLMLLIGKAVARQQVRHLSVYQRAAEISVDERL